MNNQQAPADLLQHLKLQPDSWDVLIVGDGSGSQWGHPGGWAAILFDKRTGLRKTLFGALNDTTVNICELSPYIYAMQWYVRGPGKELNRDRVCGTFVKPINVHIVTDCKVIALQGNRKQARDANAALWAAMDYYGRLNYELFFHYVPRELLAANRFCDDLSKEMRHIITSIEQRLIPENFQTADPYDDQYLRDEA